MRIVFMGTPEYAVHSLAAIAAAGHTVSAVFCQPDKPVGRKQILTPPPTKVYANDNGIPVYQPATLRNGEALDILKRISPDIIVVVAYGKILPPEILNLPRYGAINGHASLLPKLRGASPIQWAIVTGETVTGVTVMQMDEGMDTGDIINAQKVGILPDETAGELFDRLSLITADLLVETLKAIQNGTAVFKKQESSLATYAPIITKDMAHIDYSAPAKTVVNLIRGFNPWPVAYCYIDGKRYKIFTARIGDNTKAKPGTVIENGNKLVIACGEGTAINVLTLQPEGGKAMQAAQLLKGNKLNLGTVVE